MIHLLTVSNFYSVKEEQTFDFTIAKNATDPDQSFAESCIDGVRLPRVVSIYGANASGKTTVLKSLAFLEHFICDSYTYKPDKKLFYMPFLAEETRLEESTLEVEFCIKEKSSTLSIKYHYVLKMKQGEVNFEALYYYPKGRSRKLFERTSRTINAGADFDLPTRDPVRKKIRNNTSVLSVLSQFNHKFSLKVVRAVGWLLTNVNAGGKVSFDSHSRATEVYGDVPDYLEKLNDFIQWADLGIEEVILESDAEDKKYPLFKHINLIKPLEYWEESGGTRGLYLLLPYVFLALESGGIAVLDEIDAEIHPLLLPKIINLFQNNNDNPKNAQLIISAHDVTLMSCLQKEEIYFTQKNESGGTEFYGLKDIKGVRRDDNYYVKYLAGMYGAVPRV